MARRALAAVHGRAGTAGPTHTGSDGRRNAAILFGPRRHTAHRRPPGREIRGTGRLTWGPGSKCRAEMEEPLVLDTQVQQLDRHEASADEDPAVLFSAAYRSFAGPITGYLLSRGVDDPEAVTQDVFLAFFPQIQGLTGGLQGAKSLLFSIAHARMVDYYRRVERRPHLTEYDPQQDHRSSPSAEEHAVNLNTGAAALLEGLSDEHQEVLALRVVADLSIEQVAQIMGKSVGAVKQLQRRALQNLKVQTLKRNQANDE